MKIKDFIPGQEVFVTETKRGREKGTSVRKMIVSSVGRKYVKVSQEGYNSTDDFYLQDKADEYLVENKDWGNKCMLFPSRAAIEEYEEKKRLEEHFRRVFGNYGGTSLPLKALRDIKKILEDNDNE